MTEEIEQRAAEWVLKRDRNGYSSDDLAALEAWLAQDARHREAYLQHDEAWELTADLNQWNPRRGQIDADLLASVRRQSRRGRALRMMGLLAASVLLVIGAASWFRFAPPESETYSTPIGGYERITLTDGSVLQLNTGTTVETQFTGGRRQVRLLRGEAYFDVAPDSRRPFEVCVGQSIARAVGTAFSVRVGPQKQLELIVTQGRVLFLQDGQEAAQPLIAAGQVAHAEANRIAIAPLAQAEVSRRLAWQTGQLVFDRQPLTQVVQEFNRYNHRQIRIAAPELEKLMMTGNFKAADLESFVAAVRSVAPVQVDQDDNEIVIRAGI